MVFADIAYDKSPGVDGYTDAFFKKYWRVVGSKVSRAVLDFFNKGRMLMQINSTILYLIPKGHNPSGVGDYRPIACCTTIYKIISKMLCKRLVVVLPILVDPVQSAFVKERSIVDNILLCQELLNGYDRCGISPRCLARIDLRKAYDSVSWDFVQSLLKALNFPPRFRMWIMMCISTTSFLFLFLSMERCLVFLGGNEALGKEILYLRISLSSL
ncbi:hypothetical protein Dimus_039420 [Dionaea muscipula]